MTNRQWWQIVSAVVVGMLLAMVVHYVFLKSLSVLSLFALALLIAFALDPLLDRLEQRGWSRARAVWTVTFLFLALLALAVLIIVPQLVSQIQDVVAHWGDYSAKADAIYQHWRLYLEEYFTDRFPEWDVVPFLDARVAEAGEWLQSHLPAALQWVSQQLLASLGMVGMGLLLLLLTVQFMLVIDPLRQSFREMLPRETDAEVDRVSTEINRMLAQYLRGVIVVSICAGIAATGMLTSVQLIYGTKYALIVGLVTGVTYMVPYIGPVISAASAGFVGYVTATHGSPWIAALVSVLSMMLLNQVFDNVVTPRIVGRKVGLHPLVVFFAALVGASLFGLWGMIIATPVAASIKILLARWLPVRGPELTVKAPHARLELDMVASLALLRNRFSRVSRDLKHAIGGGPDENGDEAADPHPPPAACPPCPEPDQPAGDKPRPEPHDGDS